MSACAAAGGGVRSWRKFQSNRLRFRKTDGESNPVCDRKLLTMRNSSATPPTARLALFRATPIDRGAWRRLLAAFTDECSRWSGEEGRGYQAPNIRPTSTI